MPIAVGLHPARPIAALALAALDLGLRNRLVDSFSCFESRCFFGRLGGLLVGGLDCFESRCCFGRLGSLLSHLEQLKEPLVLFLQLTRRFRSPLDLDGLLDLVDVLEAGYLASYFARVAEEGEQW